MLGQIIQSTQAQIASPLLAAKGNMRTRLGGEPEKEVQALASASYGRSETPTLEGAGRHKPESDAGLRQAKSG